MTDTEELRAELSALRTLIEVLIQREWIETGRIPLWPDNLRMDGLADVDRHYKTDPLHQEIRLKLSGIVNRALF